MHFDWDPEVVHDGAERIVVGLVDPELLFRGFAFAEEGVTFLCSGLGEHVLRRGEFCVALFRSNPPNGNIVAELAWVDAVPFGFWEEEDEGNDENTVKTDVQPEEAPESDVEGHWTSNNWANLSDNVSKLEFGVGE